jgi:hypothetical protein
MRGLFRITIVALLLLIAIIATGARGNALPADDHGSIVIVYRDGHRQSLASAEIARIDVKSTAIVYKDGHTEKLHGDIDRIEFGDSSSAMTPGRSHFIGKWQVGDGNGGKFMVTLDADGDAKKSIGSSHGTWTLVDGEARIAWDDGWHDAIRKTGSKHEKMAYEPGKTFGDSPSNVTIAERTDHKPI